MPAYGPACDSCTSNRFRCGHSLVAKIMFVHEQLFQARGTAAQQTRGGKKSMTPAATASAEAELPDSARCFVRALWGLDVRVRALPKAGNEFAPRRPRFMGSNLWLPASPLLGVPGSFSDYVFAACAHISAHLRFGAARFEVNALKPAQVAIVSLLED